jgi:hypothetical protein
MVRSAGPAGWVDNSIVKSNRAFLADLPFPASGVRSLGALYRCDLPMRFTDALYGPPSGCEFRGPYCRFWARWTHLVAFGCKSCVLPQPEAQTAPKSPKLSVSGGHRAAVRGCPGYIWPTFGHGARGGPVQPRRLPPFRPHYAAESHVSSGAATEAAPDRGVAKMTGLPRAPGGSVAGVFRGSSIGRAGGC